MPSSGRWVVLFVGDFAAGPVSVYSVGRDDPARRLGGHRGFRRLRAATFFFHGEKEGKTPPGTRPMGYGLRFAPPRPIGRFPRTPLRGTHSCLMLLDFRRAKSEWSLAIPSGPTGALGLQKFRVYAIPRLRLAMTSQRSRCVFWRAHAMRPY